MRIVVISEATDLKGLQKILFSKTQPAATAAAAIERLKAMNPHVDLQHLVAGSVLLLPDLPDMNLQNSSSIGGDAFAAFAAEANKGLKSAAARVRACAESVTTDRNDVKATLSVEAVKAILGSDPTLGQQVEAASARFKADQKEAHSATDTVEKLAAQTAEELEALSKLFG